MLQKIYDYFSTFFSGRFTEVPRTPESNVGENAREDDQSSIGSIGIASFFVMAECDQMRDLERAAFELMEIDRKFNKFQDSVEIMKIISLLVCFGLAIILVSVQLEVITIKFIKMISNSVLNLTNYFASRRENSFSSIGSDRTKTKYRHESSAPATASTLLPTTLSTPMLLLNSHQERALSKLSSVMEMESGTISSNDV
ncbi:hypothetical protein BN7_6274 [Wickerhamomyces ciferrii]|uniref:Uncharacterized protein n=1 Tax=Wickerhamomyces ciferrii (strain ATCC 14091 / BCRC 22168 / CBS 111 / JCM 3599 / NBRC 0793 / NRRL Y-1031 F-60-10) TaxID=1206466 RepID=K0KXB3_WICCF|nr:uncharacterized protein BN7_6274 [Wickerhamomyces ciferrii]CCH46677.1 hypothetical protein BN7_6274 [Wickerhamomyces ciferrii]